MSLIRSKKRVADHGEVFTPAWMVDATVDFEAVIRALEDAIVVEHAYFLRTQSHMIPPDVEFWELPRESDEVEIFRSIADLTTCSGLRMPRQNRRPQVSAGA